MKISLNKKISELNEDFHNGELSLTDYRDQRRKELEALGRHQEPAEQKKMRNTKEVIKHTALGTMCVVGLLLLTVLIAKFLL